MNRALLAGAVAALSACAAPPANAPIQPAQAAPAGPVALSLPTPPPLAIPAPPQSAADWCGASRLQWLVGRLSSDIPVPVYPGARRVLCTTCPTDLSYSASRLTILFDPMSSRVTAVRCG